jgi:hypothetical protein
MNIIAQLLDDRCAKFAMTTMANLALHVGLDEQIDMLYENRLIMLVIPNRRFTPGEGIDVPFLLTEEMRNFTRCVASHDFGQVLRSQCLWFE